MLPRSLSPLLMPHTIFVAFSLSLSLSLYSPVLLYICHHRYNDDVIGLLKDASTRLCIKLALYEQKRGPPIVVRLKRCRLIHYE